MMTNKYLIAACLKNSQLSILNSQFKNLQVFAAWFEKGRLLRNDYFKNKGLDIESAEVEAEFRKHEAWKQKTQIKLELTDESTIGEIHRVFICNDYRKSYNTAIFDGTIRDDRIVIRQFYNNPEMFYYYLTHIKPDDREELNPMLYIGRLKK